MGQQFVSGLCRGYLIYGWVSLLLIIPIEVYLWSKTDDNAAVKAFRYHVYTFIEVAAFLSVRYVWKKLSLLLAPLPQYLWPLKFILQLLIVTSLVLAFITVPLGQIYVGTDPYLILLIGNFFLGIVFFLMITLVALNMSSSLLKRLIWTKGKSISVESKKATSRFRTLLSLMITLIMCVLGSYYAHTIQIQRVAIPIKGLHPRLNGTTIVQLSDLHLGPFIGRSRMEMIVEKTNKLQGDIVMITGDLVDSYVEYLWEAVKPLEKLKTKYGVYYCTGNHDYYTGDVDNWIKNLPRLKIKPLINDRVCLLPQKDPTSCEGGIYIAGLEDIDTRRIRYGRHSMDIHRALSGRTSHVPTIVLAHQPRAAAEAIHWNDVRLVLSGHTHAGQIFPFMILVYLYNPYFVGLYEPLPHVYVYVSSGTHYYLMPYRHYRPEITHITLLTD